MTEPTIAQMIVVGIVMFVIVFILALHGHELFET